MTEREVSEIRRSRPPQAGPELSVVVACHTFVCALPTRYVARLALNADVDGASKVSKGIVRCDGAPFASYNLGSLLGLRPLASAWVLLRVPHAGRHIPVALQTGTCLVVREVGVEAALPGRLFTSRGDAVLGAFVAGPRVGIEETMPYGLVLDVGRLWTEEELRSAEAAVSRTREPVQSG